MQSVEHDAGGIAINVLRHRLLMCVYTQIPRQSDIYTTATYLSDGHVRGSYPAGHPRNSRGFRYVTR